MSIRQDTSYRARMTRVMTKEGLDFSYTEPADPPWQPLSLVIPEIEVAGSEESPRFTPLYVLGWPKGYKGFSESTYPGSRLEIAEEGLFEILSPPRWLREHNDRDGWTVLAHKVSYLYPIEGVLQDQGGQDIDDMILAMWNERENQSDSGRYETMSGECPIDWTPTVNQQIDIDGRTWKVLDATPNYAGPRWELQLRAPIDA